MIQEHTCLNQLHFQHQSQAFYEHRVLCMQTQQKTVWPQKVSGRMQETNFCLLLSYSIHILQIKLPHTCGKLVKFVTCQNSNDCSAMGTEDICEKLMLILHGTCSS